MNLHTLHSQGQKMLVKTVFSILSLLLLGGIVPNSSIAQENRAPVFTGGAGQVVLVPRDTAPGTKIGAPIAATDPDGDTLKYILSGTDAGLFRIGKKTGQLRTHRPLNFEAKNTYSVAVTVSDNRWHVTIGVTIAVQGNRAPVFTAGNTLIVSVPENTTSGEHIGAPVPATDPDEDTLRYSLGGADATSFRVGKKTGQLRTHKPLDFETKAFYSVTITVSDGNGGRASINVTIQVTDVQENRAPVTDVQENRAPVFTGGAGQVVLVPRDTAPGTKIGAPIAATDPDGDTLKYILSGTDAGLFRIGKKTGQLRTHRPLNFEAKNTYSVAVTVSDNRWHVTIGVTIMVVDVQENRNMPEVPGAPARSVPPAETALLANYPNPFNPETWIPYQLSKPAQVTVTLYNIQGVIVRELALGHKPAGVYRIRSRAVHWDGRNASGEKVATGVYFYTFTAGDYTATRKMLIRK